MQLGTHSLAPNTAPNHALQTRPSHPGCNRTLLWAGSLGLGRYALKKPRTTILTLLATIAFLSSASVGRPESRRMIPDHDWTVSTTETAWGLQGYGSSTVVLAGSGHIVISLPFYAVVTLGLGGLAVVSIGALWLISSRRVQR